MISHCTYPNNAPDFILSNNWSWRNGHLYGNDSLKCSFPDTSVLKSFHHSLPHIWTTVQPFSSIYCLRISFSSLFFCSTLNIFFSYGRSGLLTRTLMIKTTHWFKHCVAMCTEPIGIKTVNLYLSSCCVKAFNSAVRSHSLKIRYDHIFETSRFVLTGLELLQICIKLVSYVQSCRHRSTHWVRVMLVSIFSKNRFGDYCGLADVSLVKNNFTCKHYWQSSKHIFTIFR